VVSSILFLFSHVFLKFETINKLLLANLWNTNTDTKYNAKIDPTTTIIILKLKVYNAKIVSV
jgi:hypothetical protein